MDAKKLFKLFISTFSLSMFTFGGGYVIVPLMRKKFVKELGWIEEQEMLDLTAIAQSSPGAMAVNASILVGYRVAGVTGACLSLKWNLQTTHIILYIKTKFLTTIRDNQNSGIIGTVLPPLIILSIISLFYTAFRDNLYVGFLLKAMQAGVSAVIVDVVIDMGGDVFKARKALPVIMMFVVFILSAFVKMNVIILILICGLIGALVTFTAKRTGKNLL